jgi:phenylpyruvate tautomerase PptA (4-oxalocrotonate tautomerase family)
MPFYQFTVTAGSISAQRKAEIAKATTTVHCEVTGAPADYVSVSFTEVPADGGLYLAGVPVSGTRMVGLIRRRPESLKRKLLLKMAEAWSSVTGEPIEDVVMFLVEIPGYQALEKGVRLPEADEEFAALQADA